MYSTLYRIQVPGQQRHRLDLVALLLTRLRGLGHEGVVHTLLHAAERRFGRHSVLKYAQLAESPEFEPPETDYVGPDGVAAQPGEDHERQDVSELMADVAFSGPSEVGTRGGEPRHPVKDAAFGWNLVFLLSLFKAKTCICGK